MYFSGLNIFSPRMVSPYLFFCSELVFTFLGLSPLIGRCFFMKFNFCHWLKFNQQIFHDFFHTGWRMQKLLLSVLSYGLLSKLRETTEYGDEKGLWRCSLTVCHVTETLKILKRFMYTFQMKRLFSELFVHLSLFLVIFNE